MHIEAIAKVCHQVNAAYCESMGDKSQGDWDVAPDWQKESAVLGVNYHLKNPDATPEDSHKEWLKIKEADGWKYGSVKDVDKKEHPCMLPYFELPIAQKAKDYIFRAIITELKEK